MSGGKAQSSQSSNSSYSPPPQVLNAYMNNLQSAQNVASTPYTPYSGSLVAPINQQQAAGISGINAASGIPQNYNSLSSGLDISAAQTPGQFNNSVAQYESPYTQQVVGATQASFNNQNAQQANQLSGQATMAGNNFGGDRAGIAQAALAGQQQISQAPVIAGLEQQGFQQAQNVAGQQQQTRLAAGNQIGALGNTAQTEAINAGTAQLNAGSLEQGTQQAANTAAYNQFMQQQGYPFQTEQYYSNILEGTGALTGGSSTGSSTTYGGSGASAGIGAATSLLSFLGKGGRVHRGMGGVSANGIMPYEMEQDPQYAGLGAGTLVPATQTPNAKPNFPSLPQSPQGGGQGGNPGAQIGQGLGKLAQGSGLSAGINNAIFGQQNAADDLQADLATGDATLIGDSGVSAIGSMARGGIARSHYLVGGPPVLGAGSTSPGYGGGIGGIASSGGGGSNAANNAFMANAPSWGTNAQLQGQQYANDAIKGIGPTADPGEDAQLEQFFVGNSPNKSAAPATPAGPGPTPTTTQPAQNTMSGVNIGLPPNFNAGTGVTSNFDPGSFQQNFPGAHGGFDRGGGVGNTDVTTRIHRDEGGGIGGDYALTSNMDEAMRDNQFNAATYGGVQGAGAFPTPQTVPAGVEPTSGLQGAMTGSGAGLPSQGSFNAPQSSGIGAMPPPQMGPQGGVSGSLTANNAQPTNPPMPPQRPVVPNSGIASAPQPNVRQIVPGQMQGVAQPGANWPQSADTGQAGAVNPFIRSLAQVESATKNIPSQVDHDPQGFPGGKSQGYFQIDTPTWQTFAAKVGVTAPNAMAATPSEQAAVVQNIPLSRFGPRTQRMMAQQYGLQPSQMNQTIGQLASKYGDANSILAFSGDPRSAPALNAINQSAGQPDVPVQGSQMVGGSGDPSQQGQGPGGFLTRLFGGGQGQGDQTQRSGLLGLNLSDQQRMMMLSAGAAMMGGTSLDPWTNIGKGLSQGIETGRQTGLAGSTMNLQGSEAQEHAAQAGKITLDAEIEATNLKLMQDYLQRHAAAQQQYATGVGAAANNQATTPSVHGAITGDMHPAAAAAVQAGAAGESPSDGIPAQAATPWSPPVGYVGNGPGQPLVRVHPEWDPNILSEDKASPVPWIRENAQKNLDTITAGHIMGADGQLYPSPGWLATQQAEGAAKEQGVKNVDIRTASQIAENQKAGEGFGTVQNTINSDADQASQQRAIIAQMKQEAATGWRPGMGANEQQDVLRAIQATTQMLGLKNSDVIDKSVAGYQGFSKNGGNLVLQAMRDSSSSSRGGIRLAELIGNKMAPNSSMSQGGFTGILTELDGLADFKMAKQQGMQNWLDPNANPQNKGSVAGFEADFNKNVTPGAFILRRMSVDQPKEFQEVMQSIGQSPGGANLIKDVQRQWVWANRKGLFDTRGQ